MRFLVYLILVFAAFPLAAQDLWQLARQKASIHRFSTLFTSQDVRDYLSSESGIEEAIEWCKRSGITKVYLETYRSRYQADREVLTRARDRFQSKGLRVSGAVATTEVGKLSTGLHIISCYTDLPTQERLRAIVEYTAALFDEIMIDHYLFTDCACEKCDAARKARMVKVGSDVFPVRSTSWEDYRLELMLQVSRIEVIEAAKRVNPRVRLILKYPQWYDRFQERGHDVVRLTLAFDRIWAGTETRDRDKPNGRMQYGAYFLMRWLGAIGGRKTGGGGFDPLTTTEATYVEQARQTVLGGAKESLLYNYGELRRNFGPADFEALLLQIPELLDVATQVQLRRPVGIAAYKPPNSAPEDEAYVYDYAGMIGLPLVPEAEFPSKAKALFLPIQAMSDPRLADSLEAYLESGKPALLTDGLARRLTGKVRLSYENVSVLNVGGRPDSLLGLDEREISAIRQPLLDALGVEFDAPADVALYLFSDNSWVIESFQDRGTTVSFNGENYTIPPRTWVYEWK
jgi:hypothetical protein